MWDIALSEDLISDDEKIASIVDGEVVVLSEGETFVTATVEGVSSAPLDITAQSASLESIAVDWTAGEDGDLYVGQTSSVSAVGHFDSDFTLDLTRRAIWSTGRTLSVNGQSGQVTALVADEGESSLVASVGGTEGSAKVVAKDLPVDDITGITLSPLVGKTFTGITVPFAAEALTSEGPIDVTQLVVWEVDPDIQDAVGTIQSGGKQAGHFVSDEPGISAINAVLHDRFISSSISVLDFDQITGVTVSMNDMRGASLLVNGQRQLKAVASTDSDVVDVTDGASWFVEAGGEEFVSMAAGGLARGQSAGQSVINASFSGHTADVGQQLTVSSLGSKTALLLSIPGDYSGLVPERISVQLRASATLTMFDGSSETEEITGHTNLIWSIAEDSANMGADLTPTGVLTVLDGDGGDITVEAVLLDEEGEPASGVRKLVIPVTSQSVESVAIEPISDDWYVDAGEQALLTASVTVAGASEALEVVGVEFSSDTIEGIGSIVGADDVYMLQINADAEPGNTAAVTATLPEEMGGLFTDEQSITVSGPGDLILESVKAVDIKTLKFIWSGTGSGDEVSLCMATADGCLQLGEVIDGGRTSAEVYLNTILDDQSEYYIQQKTGDDVSESHRVVLTTEELLGAIGYIKPGEEQDLNDFFGETVALNADGTVMAVGAYRADGDNGYVDIFLQTDGTWHHQQRINAPFPEEWFGYRLLFDHTNDDLLVGKMYLDDDGEVHVFSRDAGEDRWSQNYILKTNEMNVDFGKGIVISHSGEMMLISDPNGGSDYDGIIYEYERGQDQKWELKQKITGPASQLGHSVVVSPDGDTFAAYHHDNITEQRLVYIYVRQSDDTWLVQKVYQKEGNDIMTEGAVALIDNNTLLVADPTAESHGAVYTFTKDSDGNFQQEPGFLSNHSGSDSEPNAYGSSMVYNHASGLLAVGAPWYTSCDAGIDANGSLGKCDRAGAVWLYEKDDTQEQGWRLISLIKASNPDAYDQFSYRGLAISRDGSTLAVGAYEEDSSGTGVNPDAQDDLWKDRGAVYLY